MRFSRRIQKAMFTEGLWRRHLLEERRLVVQEIHGTGSESGFPAQ